MSVRKRWSVPHYQRLILGLMLIAALFPLYAPWLNSNFAALQPGHDHLYFGEPKHDHHHGSALNELVARTGEDAASVTNLPNLDAAGRTAVLLIIPLLLLALCAILNHFSLFEARQLGVNLFILPPPTTPPRLSLTNQ